MALCVRSKWIYLDLKVWFGLVLPYLHSFTFEWRAIIDACVPFLEYSLRLCYCGANTFNTRIYVHFINGLIWAHATFFFRLCLCSMKKKSMFHHVMSALLDIFRFLCRCLWRWLWLNSNICWNINGNQQNLFLVELVRLSRFANVIDVFASHIYFLVYHHV